MWVMAIKAGALSPFMMSLSRSRMEMSPSAVSGMTSTLMSFRLAT